MSVQLWTFIIVGLTFALYIGVAIWARAGSTKEFYVAGGGVSPLANGMATAADWMSAASYLSMAGLISFMGYVPDFIGERYYSKTARLVALLCAILVSFTYVVGQMKGVGVAFARFLEVEFATGIFIGIAIVFFYAFCFYCSGSFHFVANGG